MKGRARRVMVVVIVLGVGSFLWLSARGFTRVEHGEHFKSVNWLPSEATNVSFYRSYSFTAYEFDISEKGFLDWASRWKVSPITKPLEIMRYSFPLENKRAGSQAPPSASQPMDQESDALGNWRRKCYATITAGYYYENTSHNGGVLMVAYDKSAGRAFYLSTPR